MKDFSVSIPLSPFRSWRASGAVVVLFAAIVTQSDNTQKVYGIYLQCWLIRFAIFSPLFLLQFSILPIHLYPDKLSEDRCLFVLIAF